MIISSVLLFGGLYIKMEKLYLSRTSQLALLEVEIEYEEYLAALTRQPALYAYVGHRGIVAPIIYEDLFERMERYGLHVKGRN